MPTFLTESNHACTICMGYVAGSLFSCTVVQSLVQRTHDTTPVVITTQNNNTQMITDLGDATDRQ